MKNQTLEQRFAVCLCRAANIVAQYRAAAPEGFDVFNVDFTVVPANVLSSPKSGRQVGTAGVTLIDGQVLAKDTDGSIKLHDANGAAPLNVVEGIALHGTLLGQPIVYVKSDPNFTPGFSSTIGVAVISSATPGGMAPDADKASGWFVTELGRFVSTSQMKLSIAPVGVAIP